MWLEHLQHVLHENTYAAAARLRVIRSASSTDEVWLERLQHVLHENTYAAAARFARYSQCFSPVLRAVHFLSPCIQIKTAYTRTPPDAARLSIFSHCSRRHNNCSTKRSASRPSSSLVSTTPDKDTYAQVREATAEAHHTLADAADPRPFNSSPLLVDLYALYVSSLCPEFRPAPC